MLSNTRTLRYERFTPAYLRPIFSPILRIDAACHIEMEGGIRPVGHPRDMAMLERVDMDVIHMDGGNPAHPGSGVPSSGAAKCPALHGAAGFGCAVRSPMTSGTLIFLR